MAIELAKKLFRAEFADVRPVSGVCANLVVYTAFTDVGDTMFSLSIASGGHISTGRKSLGGTAGSVSKLNVEYFPFDVEEMNIDVDETKKKVKQIVDEGKKVKLAMFGGSVLTQPHPLKELADTFHEIGAKVCYDGAHVAGLVAGGKFQDPLREGADVMSMSTHKTLFGPQGGCVLSFNRYAELIKRATFPSNVSNHHLHHLCGKAIAFAEFLEFGKEYASQVIKNAKALAQALNERGFQVLGEQRGFTQSHIVIVDITKYGLGGDLEEKLEKANIILNRNLLAYDLKYNRHYQNPGGIRLGSQECTRLGMKESDMDHIADLIARVVIEGEDPERVRRDVIDFRKGFYKLHYCFESTKKAYEYIKLR
ncbi:MAG: serine hydroxymethyltransferase [Candidatus Methylarchaceae archaeon HK01B]|nr:serine hydroxymethyltransferase [Candidatus Methylarchaceae archaeon HK01B]